MKPRHAAIVLAAGASRRMGRSKQLIQINGTSLIRRAVLAALATTPTRVLVVVGAHADDVFAAVADLSVERVDCPDWEEGMAASLRAGFNALCDAEDEGAMLLLCDQPGLAESHLLALHTTWLSRPAGACASAYAGTIGVPALLPRAWFADVQALRGDCGARDLLRGRVDEVIAIDAPLLARDLDTPADFV